VKLDNKMKGPLKGANVPRAKHGAAGLIIEKKK
jgi:hypothetical protein